MYELDIIPTEKLILYVQDADQGNVDDLVLDYTDSQHALLQLLAEACVSDEREKIIGELYRCLTMAYYYGNLYPMHRQSKETLHPLWTLIERNTKKDLIEASTGLPNMKRFYHKLICNIRIANMRSKTSNPIQAVCTVVTARDAEWIGGSDNECGQETIKNGFDKLREAAHAKLANTIFVGSASRNCMGIVQGFRPREEDDLWQKVHQLVKHPLEIRENEYDNQPDAAQVQFDAGVSTYPSEAHERSTDVKSTVIRMIHNAKVDMLERRYSE